MFSENETTTTTDRELAEAGERRRAAMAEKNADTYRALRAEVNDGDDKLEVRSLDAFDLAALFLPEGRDVPWDEFVQRGVDARVVSVHESVKKVSAQGLLAGLRVNGAVTATGVPPIVRRVPRPQTATTAQVEFHPFKTEESETAQLRRQVDLLERRLREIENHNS